MAPSLDQIATSYTQKIIQGWERVYHLKWAYTYQKLVSFTNRGRALEMGCADGAMSRLLVRDFSSLTIVDGAPSFLKDTEALLRKESSKKEIKFIHSYFEDFDSEEKFDAIFLVHVLEHLEDPVYVLKRAKNWLSSKGVLLVNVPNAHSIHRRAGVKMGLLRETTDLNDQDKLLGHRRVYTPALLRQHLAEAGLCLKHFGGIMLKPVSNRQMNEWDESLLTALFEMGEEFPELSSELYAVLNNST